MTRANVEIRSAGKGFIVSTRLPIVYQVKNDNELEAIGNPLQQEWAVASLDEAIEIARKLLAGVPIA